MPRYLILSQSDISANILIDYVKTSLSEMSIPYNDPHRIVFGRNVPGIEAYECFIRCIEFAAKGENSSILLNDVVVLVDSVDPFGLNVIGEGWGWSSLVAMLILTFPEIRWIFGSSHSINTLIDDDKEDNELWKASIEPYHNLAALGAHARRDPVFDPTGLRDWVRKRTNKENEKDDLVLPFRSKRAAAIDDEKSYAYMHGYTAYRFGYRADAVTTWELMKELYGGEGSTQDEDKPHGYSLLLEDMSLNFPDRPVDMHLLQLDNDGKNGRAKWCPKLNSTNSTLEDSECRILITTGQTRPGDTTLAENRAYLRTKTKGRGKVVFKPASGMFDLWDQMGLFKKCPGGSHKGNEENFYWPPEPAQDSNKVASGHGAPGKLLLVADALIQRSENMLDNVKSVCEAVRGAVLATDALELTGGRTPTTAFEALSLKHQFEVTAECQFSGVEYHIQMKPRLEEIKREISVIGRWFASSQRTNAMLNAEMHILNQLVRILRDNNQFDEEQFCMNRVRHLHNILWMRQKPYRWAMWPLLGYLELLLLSFPVFVVILLGWIIGLSLLYWSTATHANLGYALSDAVTSFFSIGGPIHPTNGQENTISTGNAVVINIAIVSGFVHLGVFISHLYSIIARR